jgi:hypothetical protein
MSKFAPVTMRMQTQYQLSANRYWVQLNPVAMDQDADSKPGWIQIKNTSTFDTLRVHFDGSGDEAGRYEEIAPLTDLVFQMPQDSNIWVSSGSQYTPFTAKYSQEKPTPQMFTDFPTVQNGNLAAALAGPQVNTVIDCTVLGKGFGEFVQFIALNAGNPTLEISTDGGLTYGAVITLDFANPNRQVFTETKVFTHLRINQAAGENIYYYVS